jgi:phage terminase small subunit
MLSQQQRIFVAEYLKNGLNATSAAISAGYSEKTARQQASRLLSNVDIKDAIGGKCQQVLTKLDYGVERTLTEVARLAFLDVGKMFESDGSLKRIQDMDEDSRAAIAGMEVTDIWDSGEGEQKSIIGNLKKIKIADKNSALDKLMRYHALYRDRSDLPEEIVVRVIKCNL